MPNDAIWHHGHHWFRHDKNYLNSQIANKISQTSHMTKYRKSSIFTFTHISDLICWSYTPQWQFQLAIGASRWTLCDQTVCGLTQIARSSWGQHGAHLGPVGPRWPYEPCYQGSYSRGPFHQQRLIKIWAYKCDHHCFMWDVITYWCINSTAV